MMEAAKSPHDIELQSSPSDDAVELDIVPRASGNSVLSRQMGARKPSINKGENTIIIIQLVADDYCQLVRLFSSFLEGTIAI